MQRFANEINVDTSTLYRWSTATKANSEEPLYPEFCIAYARAKNSQMAIILEAGFVGALKSPFLNLFMKNVHSWYEKVEQEVTHKGSIDFDQVNKELADAAIQEAEDYQKLLAEG